MPRQASRLDQVHIYSDLITPDALEVALDEMDEAVPNGMHAYGTHGHFVNEQ